MIDDFGRQRMRIDELLNRWIVPLETRYDFLNLPNGKKIKVPFDQLVVFSTNLEPREMVDEAFFRRIPYKIEVVDATEEEFRQLFQVMGPKLGVAYRRRRSITSSTRTTRRPAGRSVSAIPATCCSRSAITASIKASGRNDQRAFRPGRGELLCGDVSHFRVGLREQLLPEFPRLAVPLEDFPLLLADRPA